MAAEKLSYTPSGVSRAIEAVEAQTGFPLFRRGKKGAELTEEGNLLLPAIRQLEHWGRQYHETSQKILGLDVGHIVFGSAYSSFFPQLAEIIGDFGERYPGIQIEIIEGTSTELAAKMDRHTLDFGIISRREGSFRWLSLGKDELMVIMNRENPLAQGERVPVHALLKEDYIEIFPGEDTDNSRFFRSLGGRPRVRFSTTDSAAAVARA